MGFAKHSCRSTDPSKAAESFGASAPLLSVTRDPPFRSLDQSPMDTPPAELIPECSIHSSPATFAQNSPFFFQILAIASILKCRKRLEMWLAVVGQSRANQELYEREAIDGAARGEHFTLTNLLSLRSPIRHSILQHQEVISHTMRSERSSWNTRKHFRG